MTIFPLFLDNRWSLRSRNAEAGSVLKWLSSRPKTNIRNWTSKIERKKANFPTRAGWLNLGTFSYFTRNWKHGNRENGFSLIVVQIEVNKKSFYFSFQRSYAELTSRFIWAKAQIPQHHEIKKSLIESPWILNFCRTLPLWKQAKQVPNSKQQQ